METQARFAGISRCALFVEEAPSRQDDHTTRIHLEAPLA
jgi:hypothetical protein